MKQVKLFNKKRGSFSKHNVAFLENAKDQKNYARELALYFFKLAGLKKSGNTMTGLGLICNSPIETRLLYELLFWTEKDWCQNSGSGRFYKSYVELSTATNYSVRSLKYAKAWMESEGFLETDVKWVNKIRTIHWKLDFKKLKAFGRKVLVSSKTNKNYRAKEII